MEYIKWYLGIILPTIKEEDSDIKKEQIREYRESLKLPLFSLVISIIALLNRVFGL